MKKELTRKGIHLLPLSIPLAYSYDLFSYPTIVIIVTAVTLVFAGLDLLRLKFPVLRRAFMWLFGNLIRKHEYRFLTGSTFILLSFTISLIVFPKPIAVAVMYYTVLGDGMASLIGKKWGKIKLGRRTLEGSIACLVTCLVVGSIVEGLSFSLVLIGALGATTVEGLSGKVDDNMTIPFISGLLMMVWSRGFGI
jgi:dolichol kinase